MEIKKEVEEEKKKMKEIIIEKDNLISELEVKTNLSKQELSKYLKQIKEKEIELREKNDQINLIKNQFKSEINNSIIDRNQYFKLRKYIRLKLLPELDNEIISSELILKKYFNKRSKNYNSKFIKDMQEAGLLDETNTLTRIGIDFIRQIAQDI